MLTRRNALQLGSATLGGLLTRQLWAEQAAAARGTTKFYIALVADTHIIDEFYKPGSENGVEDNESILLTTPRLTAARDLINSLHPPVEHVFLIGDCFHNYPSPNPEFYAQHTTRLDLAKRITDGFHAQVHLGFGNHDYDVRNISRETSHALFRAKLHAEPYSVLDYKGCRFVHVNNFLGSTQDRAAADFNPAVGSLGEVQLQWLEAQLAARKPTFLFIHYPLLQVVPTEVADFGLHPLLRRHADTLRLVVSGHLHRWIDFAHTYGPQHYVMAATRYDPNAMMLLEIDARDGSWRFLNQSLVEWSTHFSQPYRSA